MLNFLTNHRLKFCWVEVSIKDCWNSLGEIGLNPWMQILTRGPRLGSRIRPINLTVMSASEIIPVRYRIRDVLVKSIYLAICDT